MTTPHTCLYQRHNRILRHTRLKICHRLPSLQLPRFRNHGKREAAAKLERNVMPRIELSEEDELFVSSQLQSFREQVREHVYDHGAEGIGAHAVFVECDQLSANRITFRRRRSFATRLR